MSEAHARLGTPCEPILVHIRHRQVSCEPGQQTARADENDVRDYDWVGAWASRFVKEDLPAAGEGVSESVHARPALRQGQEEIWPLKGV